jgi:adenine phosphoribosyltransferase
MVRKQGKLPAATEAESYSLEYGESRLEVHRDAVEPGQRVVVIDDVLATGGTASAAGRLLSRLGAEVDGYGFMIELKSLAGRAALGGSDVFSLMIYE